MSNRLKITASHNRRAFIKTAILLTLSIGNLPALADQGHGDMALISAGTYQPFFIQKDKSTSPLAKPETVKVEAFWLDKYPVTNRQFLDFVRKNAEWRKSKVKRIFADTHYLDRWQSDQKWPSPYDGNLPVANVSWFAAEAYCESRGKSLPTTDQWEYALMDQGRHQDKVRDKALAWYGAPNPSSLPAVGTTGKNGFGLYDMVGLIWEWTQDFNSFMAGAELRDRDGKDRALFCGNGSAGVKDATDYAAFMRFSLRASIKASYTTDNLGFRCAKEYP